MHYGDFPGIHAYREELHRITESWRLQRPFADWHRDLAVSGGLVERNLQGSLDLMSRSVQELRDGLLAAGVETQVHAIRQALAESAQTQIQGIEQAFAGGMQAQVEAVKRALTEDVQNCINNSKSLIEANHAFALEASGCTAILDSYVVSLRDVRHLLPASQDWATRQELTAALAAMRDDLLLPGTGLLTSNHTTSMLTWGELSDSDLKFSAAAWLLEPIPRQNEDAEVAISVACEVRCAFCGDELISEREERFHVSRRRVSIVLDIVPLCGICIRKAEQDPEYWTRHLDRFRETDFPALRLIPGEGTGSGEPRGRGILRLVSCPQDEDQ